MRKLGEVLHVAKNGYIVIKLEVGDKLPPLGVKVYDEYHRELGQLFDIIGPTKQPYGVVKPADKSVRELVRP
ncbi:MAG: Gar1/Naf1 family protein, partial [Pyrodictiaceae archaeon]